MFAGKTCIETTLIKAKGVCGWVGDVSIVLNHVEHSSDNCIVKYMLVKLYFWLWLQIINYAHTHAWICAPVFQGWRGLVS